MPRKISEMTAASTLTGAELVPVVQSGNNRRTTPAAFATEAPIFTQEGADAVARTLQDKARDVISAFDYMSTAQKADIRAYTYTVEATTGLVKAAAALTNGMTLWFPRGGYLVDYAGAANSDDYGKKVIYLSSKDGITLAGNGATIKCVSHNIATNGGLMFFWGTDVSRLTIEGFDFDMTFTGVKNSSSHYPYCGAIIVPDTATGAKTQAQLSGDIIIRDCSFKLYHPYGQYATTTAGNDYGGDTNNAFKLFSAFVSGDNLATAYANQNRNVTFKDLTFKDGHNGYGVWAWSYNNVICEHIIGEAWVGKYSTNAGAVAGEGVPMIRYHQFYNSGIDVSKCQFRAKPCDERTTSGFEGVAIFLNLSTNLTGNHSHGKSMVHDNVVVLGNGDSANSFTDVGVQVNVYGDVQINNNELDGITTTTNAYAGTNILYNPESGGGNGNGSLMIDGNTFGRSNSYNNNISFLNGDASAAAERRCKSLHVTNNISLSQLQYFLDMTGASAVTYLGCAYTVIAGNTIIGTNNTVWGAASANSRAFRLAATEATDIMRISGGIVEDKNILALTTSVNTSADVVIENVQMSGITTYFSGTHSGIKKRFNTGYVTEATGASSVASGTTSIAVTHGLAAAPTNINVIFLEQGTNDYGRWWISAAGATTFTVNVSADPGASNLDFRWDAKTY